MALSESRRLPPLYRQPTDLHIPSSSLSHRKRARSPEPSLFLSPLEEETLNRVVPPKHSTTTAAAPTAPVTTTYGAGGGATAHRRVDPSSLSSPSPLVDSTWLQRNINRFVSLFVRYSTAASATSSSPSRRTVGPSSSSSVVKGPTATATVVPQPLPPANSTTTVLLTPLKRKAPAADPPPSSKKIPSGMQQQKNATVPSSWESPVRPTVGGNRSKLPQQHRSAFPYGSATLSQTQRNQTSRTLPLDEVPSTPQLSGLNHDYINVDDDDEEQRPGRAKYLIDDVLSVAQLARLVPSLRVAGPSATSSSSTASPTGDQATKKRDAEAEKLAAYIREDVAMREIYDAVVEEAVQKIVSTRAVRCSALLSALTESIVSHALRATLSRHIPRKAGVLRSLRLQQRQRQRLSESPPQHRPTTASAPFVMELDEEDRQYVSRVFSRGSDLTPVIERDGFKILRNQLGTLNGTQWVNDQVINYYFHLLSQQRPASYPVVRDLSLQPGTPRPDVLSLGSHVYTRIAAGDVQGALRWVRRQESIFDCRVVLVPINLNNTHWSWSTMKDSDWNTTIVWKVRSVDTVRKSCAMLPSICKRRGTRVTRNPSLRDGHLPEQPKEEKYGAGHVGILGAFDCRLHGTTSTMAAIERPLRHFLPADSRTPAIIVNGHW